MTTVSFEVPETITVTVKGLGAYTVEVATIHADFLPFLFVRGVTRYVGGEGAAVASKDDDGNARDAADVLIDKKNKVTMYLAALVSGKLPRPGGAIGEEVTEARRLLIAGLKRADMGDKPTLDKVGRARDEVTFRAVCRELGVGPKSTEKFLEDAAGIVALRNTATTGKVALAD